MVYKKFEENYKNREGLANLIKYENGTSQWQMHFYNGDLSLAYIICKRSRNDIHQVIFCNRKLFKNILKTFYFPNQKTLLRGSF
jgi:hypothetical protein